MNNEKTKLIVNKLTENFLNIFFENLKEEFTGDLLNFLNVKQQIFAIASTGAWSRVFEKTCNQLGDNELLEQYNSLEWDKSDDIDYIICLGLEKMINQKREEL